MRCRDAGRTHWGAYCVGAASQLLDYELDHVSVRETFGRRLRDHRMADRRHGERAACCAPGRL
ncbi:hypothetical protein [Bradyrhizobium sp. CER78]|uniref:hypothetical protein n=1 Tax=Bradyrhizobium sp. CER78 TaxID=3039162 RepID=UPI00244B6927|nr:hypothetical protein [Bradyrhizobium sp. CER78]MDH2385135.1 hypothetical protein [Bradyrhizobium sp. CER78]